MLIDWYVMYHSTIDAARYASNINLKRSFHMGAPLDTIQKALASIQHPNESWIRFHKLCQILATRSGTSDYVGTLRCIFFLQYDVLIPTLQCGICRWNLLKYLWKWLCEWKSYIHDGGVLFGLRCMVNLWMEVHIPFPVICPMWLSFWKLI